MTDRAQQLRQAFFVALALFVGGMLAITAYTLWRLHGESVSNGLTLSASYSRSAEDFLTQNLYVTELAADNAGLMDNDVPNLRDIERSFVSTLKHTPFLRSLPLLNAQGRIVASSNPANVGVALATASYLPQVTVNPAILRIGQPWSGRDFADGHPSSIQAPVAAEAIYFVPLTRTFTLGQRSVTLLVALNPDYFINHLSQTMAATQGTIEVLRYDGTLLMTTDANERVGTLHDYLGMDLRAISVDAGQFEQDAGEKERELTAYRASPLYPLMVMTHLHRDQALASWRVAAKTLLGVVIPTLLFICFLAVAFYRRQLQLAAQRAEAERLQRITATVFEASTEAIIITDRDANIISVNAAFTRITGYSEQEVLGRNPRLLASGRQDKSFYEQLWRKLLDEGIWQGEIVNRCKDGRFYDARMSIVISRDSTGAVQHFIGDIFDITDRKKADAQRIESESRLRALINALPDLIWLKDVEGVYRACNTRFEQFFGTSEQHITGKTDYDFVEKELADSFRQNDQLAMTMTKGGLHTNEEWITFANDGHRELLETTKIPMFDPQGGLIGVLGLGHDITEKKQSEEKLQLAASVFAHSREGIMITTADGLIVDVNDAFSRITGYQRDEVVGRNPRILSSGRQGPEFYARMWQHLLEQGHCYGEVWNRRKNGEVYAEMQTISAVRDADGATQHYVSLFSDITALKEHQNQLEHIAHFDALTNLPNRVLLADRLRQGMTQVQRRGQLLAVAFLDLDGFKGINDQYGHEAGDQLLIAVGKRMKQALREGDTLARIGGDEFVAVLMDLPTADASGPMLSRLQAAAAQPMLFGDTSLQVSASLGVTFYPQAEEVDADLLLRQADQAMYQAKLAGKNRYHVFDAEQDRSLRGHHESVERIRAALAAREFVLYYQPKVNMRTGQVIGAEALIRWQHPQRGLLAPALFLPVIEDHSLAIDLGEWVIDTALGQLEHWQELGLAMPISVNVGARQLQQADFVERLCAMLAAHPGVPTGQLMLEVLETSALEDMNSVAGVIEVCRAMGVMFALDDFGTGYSSLTYLKRLQVKQLKIDQSFVRDMLDDPDDLAILDGVIGLASAFRREVIAEGVETVAHGTMLLQLGCELAQGYGIARPMPADQLPGWVAAWQPDADWVDLPPVHREDLPLLFAMVEHRAWILAVEAFFKGESEVPLPLAIEHCRLSHWLQTEGATRYGTQAAFQSIAPLHQQVHALVATMCDVNSHGPHLLALARLHELHTLRDALLLALAALVQRPR